MSKKAFIDAINRLLAQLDKKKVAIVYQFVLHLIK